VPVILERESGPVRPRHGTSERPPWARRDRVRRSGTGFPVARANEAVSRTAPGLVAESLLDADPGLRPEVLRNSPADFGLPRGLHFKSGYHSERPGNPLALLGARAAWSRCHHRIAVLQPIWLMPVATSVALQSAERLNSSIVCAICSFTVFTPEAYAVVISVIGAFSAASAFWRETAASAKLRFLTRSRPSERKSIARSSGFGRRKLITEIVGDNGTDDERRLFGGSHSLQWLYGFGQPRRSQAQPHLFNVKVHSADQNFRQYMLRFIFVARKTRATNVPSITERSSDSVSPPKSHDKRKNLKRREGRYVEFRSFNTKAMARARAA
jgi:hypothetical protein